MLLSKYFTRSEATYTLIPSKTIVTESIRWEGRCGKKEIKEKVINT
jgi:hypothetical protein